MFSNVMDEACRQTLHVAVHTHIYTHTVPALSAGRNQERNAQQRTSILIEFFPAAQNKMYIVLNKNYTICRTSKSIFELQY